MCSRSKIERINYEKSHEVAVLYELLTAESKNALAVYSEHFDLMMRKTNGSFQHTMLKEEIITNHMAFSIPKECFMFKPLSQKISQLIEAGLAKKFVNRENEDKYRPIIQEFGPVVFTLNHLGVGFLAWLTFIIVACFAFILEIFINAMQKMATKLVIKVFCRKVSPFIELLK